MKKYLLKTYSKKFLVDTITPVSVYLRIRDKFHNSLLLESSDYNSNNNSFSYICFNQIAKFEVFNNEIIKQFPDNIEVRDSCTKDNILKELETFINSFEINKDDLPFINNGLFGFTAYDAVQYFEDIKITKKNNPISIPEMYYGIYKNIIAIDLSLIHI